MNNFPKDIVLDTNVMRLYDKPKDQIFVLLFKWLRTKGTLTMSRKMLNEYGGSGKQPIFVLINELQREGRYNLVTNQALQNFNADRHFNYTCNFKDRNHARLVFLSYRKLLVAFDDKLTEDVNKFKKIDGIKPKACQKPSPDFYE
jgi:hypothetical protein